LKALNLFKKILFDVQIAKITVPKSKPDNYSWAGKTLETVNCCAFLQRSGAS
jgi:hypothetical protein